MPGAITLPHMPSRAPYTRPGQFAARLGVEHDPLYVHGDFDKPLSFKAPALVLHGDVSVERLKARRGLLQTIDDARREFDAVAGVGKWSQLQERAFSLLGSSRTATAFEVAGEPQSLRERYGETVNGMSLLLARRLVEAEVPFITVFWMENLKIADKCKSAGGWDTHGNNFNCLREHLLPEFDRGFSALIEDLTERGLLDQTLLLVTSEMGRTPKIGDVRSGGIGRRRTRPLDPLHERADGRRGHSRRPGVRIERPPRRVSGRATNYAGPCRQDGLSGHGRN